LARVLFQLAFKIFIAVQPDPEPVEGAKASAGLRQAQPERFLIVLNAKWD